MRQSSERPMTSSVILYVAAAFVVVNIYLLLFRRDVWAAPPLESVLGAVIVCSVVAAGLFAAAAFAIVVSAFFVQKDQVGRLVRSDNPLKSLYGRVLTDVFFPTEKKVGN